MKKKPIRTCKSDRFKCIAHARRAPTPIWQHPRTKRTISLYTRTIVIIRRILLLLFGLLWLLLLLFLYLVCKSFLFGYIHHSRVRVYAFSRSLSLSLPFIVYILFGVHNSDGKENSFFVSSGCLVPDENL